jgi:hypothetical protein
MPAMAAAAAMEPQFDVVWPLGRKVFPESATQDRVTDLSGKTVAEFWDYLFRGEDIFPILRERLAARYPGIKFVTYETFGNLHGPQQRELVARVPQLLKDHKVDAVISAIGA